jgi:hypothetical protein
MLKKTYMAAVMSYEIGVHLEAQVLVNLGLNTVGCMAGKTGA